MKDSLGQEINVNDVVGASSYAVRTTPFIVVGFTAKQVKLVRPDMAHRPTEYITKPPSEILVIPGGAERLAELNAASKKN